MPGKKGVVPKILKAPSAFKNAKKASSFFIKLAKITSKSLIKSIFPADGPKGLLGADTIDFLASSI